MCKAGTHTCIDVCIIIAKDKLKLHILINTRLVYLIRRDVEKVWLDNIVEEFCLLQITSCCPKLKVSLYCLRGSSWRLSSHSNGSLHLL